MIRSWPKILEDDDIAIKWPKNLGLVILLGIFSILFILLIPGLIIMYLNGMVPKEVGLIGFAFVFLIIFLFGLVIIGGFISAIKNQKNPFIRFLANHEGLFMNITFKKKDAFYVSWNDIEKIEKTTIKRSMSRGTMIVDALGIFLKPSSNCTLPKVLRGVEDCTKEQINFAKDTLDYNFDELITKIIIMKDKYSN
jgi:hypothetical protein